jgi:thiosulfate dehydrogenase
LGYKLTNEQAWDVSAYITAQPRPVKTFSFDWPNIAKKPVDHPFGPFADSFSAEQHKFGPFRPIKEAKELSKRN